MIQRILCPLDGSYLSDEILTQVRRILCKQDAEVVLLRVLPAPGAVQTTDEEGELRRAHYHLDRQRAALEKDGVKVRCELVTGDDPAQEIVRIAEGCEPSLVAMTTHGRTGFDRWVRGSVAERVLERCRFPILTANPAGLGNSAEKGQLRFERILVPVDGSERAMAILPLVGEIARMYESTVLLFYVAPMPKVSKNVDPKLVKYYTAAEAAPVLEPYRAQLEKDGIAAKIYTGAGDPAQEILLASEQGQCDLVAMTTHGRTGVTRWLYGSVAEKVLRHLRWPLLVKRTG